MTILKKIMIKIINYITSFAISMSLFIKIIIKSFIFKKKIYIFGVPIHGNLGDQAILYAEELFLKDNFNNYKIIEVPSKFNSNFLKRIVKKSIILYTGGGFLGSLWLKEEEMFRTTLKMYPDNKIVVLPHTFYFSNDIEGKKVLEESIKIYTEHNDLHLICREKYSYDFMKQKFPKCTLYIAPDMVLYLNKEKNENGKKGVLMCFRNDKERISNESSTLKIKLKQCGYNIFDESSTVVNNNIFPFQRKKFVLRKINEFSKYNLIITDRLHGMIFAYLANTPCIVFENKSYKIKGVYEWIKDCGYIKLVNNFEKKSFDEVINNNSNNYEVFKEKFEIIKNVIKENVNDKKNNDEI